MGREFVRAGSDDWSPLLSLMGVRDRDLTPPWLRGDVELGCPFLEVLRWSGEELVNG